VESPGIVLLKFPGPGKFWKKIGVLESPGIFLATKRVGTLRHIVAIFTVSACSAVVECG